MNRKNACNSFPHTERMSLHWQLRLKYKKPYNSDVCMYSFKEEKKLDRENLIQK